LILKHARTAVKFVGVIWKPQFPQARSHPWGAPDVLLNNWRGKCEPRSACGLYIQTHQPTTPPDGFLEPISFETQ